MAESITFSTPYQRAILGHALRDASLWEQLDEYGANKDWLIEQAESVKETVKDCARAAAGLGVDMVSSQLGGWLRSRTLVTRVKEIEKVFNSQGEDAACDILARAATEIQRIEVVGSFQADHLASAAVRIDEEAAERRAEEGKYLTYGVKYLDEATGGISPHDLIVMGAKTGAGKTQLVTNIASHNALKGRPVAFFALEAENNEIERRLKYQLMAERFRYAHKDSGRSFQDINYGAWRLGEIGDRIDAEYEAWGTEQVKARYSNIITYYRNKSDFGMTQLEREIYKVHKKVKLIILDHLHYMDFDGGGHADDENAQMKRLVKRLKHITQVLGVPIIAIAHLRKTSGKTLIPGIDDFHGSSDITKICTSAIMIGPAYDIASTKVGGHATFMRLAKHRLEGSRTTKIGVTFFDPVNNRYVDKYGLGSLNFMETKWMESKEFPLYAKGAISISGNDPI